MTPQDAKTLNLSETFGQAAAVAAPEGKRPRKPHKLKPFSIRFSREERAYLEELAGKQPLGAYIRDQLLGDKAQKRRKSRKPALEDGQYAALLAALGESRLSSNLNQLAHHANTGTLDVTENTERQLQDAYDAILAMREALFTALGLKSGSNP